MARYTTGELAKLCATTVRTVQFYDAKGLLKPSELSDGGRRLYSTADLQRMRTICFLKDLGFSLKDINVLLNEETSSATLNMLIDGRLQDLESEIATRCEQRERVEELKSDISHLSDTTIHSIGAMATVMGSKKKLRNMRIKMVVVGCIMDVAWIPTLIYGILSGIWWPFAVGAIVAVILGILISRYYIMHVAYVCPEDHVIFRPSLGKMLFSAHTPSMRKLTCPICGHKTYCLEVYVPDSHPRHVGDALVWPAS